MSEARYDGIADAYNAFRDANETYYRPSDDALRRFLGHGAGRCVDIGCGGGQFLTTLLDLGWTPVGVDASEDQLKVARERFPELELVKADATRLPFPDATLDAGISAFTHSDFDDFGGAMREAHRVLKPGAPFVYVGNHPCFVGATQEH